NAVSGARGRATVVVRRLRDGLDPTLAVVVRKLRPSTTYDVTADGTAIGTVTTDAAGNGRARFRSRPRGQDQALGVDPRGKTIGVQVPVALDEHRGRDEGDDYHGDGDHHDNDNRVRCCVLDEEENDNE